ncbi:MULTISPECIES: carbohydrate ABC transporter permease [unclassified Haladaptatus]|uniref:carbohydrate ABC transporter permease n=1 Tax=unclassified Haladaptatus TaxID=2622732 RepID=UPI0023E80D4A|nr:MULTISPECIES: sugar ABC transporter permease [unclassified Haladaptatus]
MSSFEYAQDDSESQGTVERAVSYLQDHWTEYALITPSIVFLAAVVLYPILETLRLAFYESPRTSTVEVFVGLQNFNEIFSDPFFYQLLWQTFRWVALAVTIKTLLGLLIAVHLNQDIKGRKFFRTAFLIPWGIPYAISAVIFRWIEQPQYGYLNAILLKLGLIDQQIGLLGDPSIAWLGAIAADIWIGTPFMAIIFLAGLQSIPEELYEAAAVDGAYRWVQFRYITIPQLKPVILIATLLSTIWTFVGFDVIWTMTRGGPLDSTATLVIWIYKTGFENGNLGMAAAYSSIGFAILLVFAILYLRIYMQGGEEI